MAERKAQLTPYHRLVYLREQGITTFNLFSFSKTVLPWFLVSLVTHLHKKEKIHRNEYPRKQDTMIKQ